MLKKITSGGQTGVDRAALDVALMLGFNCGGYCPKGRRAEDGTIAPGYPLLETPSSDYQRRTIWNVENSDGTLILAGGELLGGTGFTAETALTLKRPFFIVDLNKESEREPV